MFKKALGISVLLLACGTTPNFDVSKVAFYDNSRISILNDGNNFEVIKKNDSSFQKKVDYINNYLENLKTQVNGYQNIKIASVSTGISNFLYQMGVPLTAVSNSQALSASIKEKRMNYNKNNFVCKSKDDDNLLYREKGEKINNYVYQKTGCYKYDIANDHTITFLPNIKPMIKDQEKLNQQEQKSHFFNLGNPLKPSLEILEISKANVIFSNTSLLAAIDHKKSSFYSGKIPSIFLPTKSFEDVFVILETVGKKLGSKTKVDRLWKEFYNYQNQIKKLTASQEKPLKSLFLMRAGTSFYAYGKKSSAYSIAQQLSLEFLGKENDQNFYKFSKEQIIKQDPEVLIISIHGYSPELATKMKKEFYKLDWIKETSAYKNNAVYIVKDYSLISHQTYSVVHDLAAKIYGSKNG